MGKQSQLKGLNFFQHLRFLIEELACTASRARLVGGRERNRGYSFHSRDRRYCSGVFACVSRSRRNRRSSGRPLKVGVCVN